MRKVDVIRAWKDEEYYLSLSEEERAALPAHPSGLIHLADEDLRRIAGGTESTIEACTVPHLWCTREACTIDSPRCP